MKMKVALNEIARLFSKDIMARIGATIDLKKSKLERHLAITEVKDVNTEKKVAEIYLSTRRVDHDGDIVTPTGWDLSFYNLNPKGLWAHNSSMQPIYKALWTKADDYGLKQSIQFAETEFASDMWELVKGGFMKTFSAGFKSEATLTRDDKSWTDNIRDFKNRWPEFTDDEERKAFRIISEKILFESSLCNIPCNPYALVVALGEGKVKVCEEVKEALKVEEYIKKGIDDGLLDRKYGKASLGTGEPASDTKTDTKTDGKKPQEKTEENKTPVVSRVLEIKEVLQIRPVMVENDIKTAVEKSIKKIIDKRRGDIG